MNRTFLLALLFTPQLTWAQIIPLSDGPEMLDRAGNYRTRDDRREAGFGTQITDWLTFSGLFENESTRHVLRTESENHYRDYDTDPAVQAAFDAEILNLFDIELIFEYTEDNADPLMDEVIISADLGEIGLDFGRYYLPFGLYYSHFITGPALEFAETRRDTIQFGYEFAAESEILLFAFDTKFPKAGSSSPRPGWGFALDGFSMNGRLNYGFGYLSNLSEADFGFLEDNGNQFVNQVGAINAYAVYEANTWDISIEAMSATERFFELDEAFDKPASLNIESAWYPNSKLEVALRYERNREILEEPEQRYGLAFTWRLSNHISITTEVLKEEFAQYSFETGEDIYARDGYLSAFWFAFEF